MHRPPSLVMLTPPLHALGGVQLSGRIAGAAIQDSLPDAQIFESNVGQTGRGFRRLLLAWQALRQASPNACFLVWHLGLARLLPFFRTRGRTLCLFLHGVEAWRKHSGLTLLMLRRVDHFLTNSRYTWDRFLDIHPEFQAKPHTVVHLGMGVPTDAALTPPSDRPTAIMISRLERSENYKGHDEVLRAWPLLLERVPDARLVIVGDGDLRPTLELRVANSGLENSVEFLGSVSEEKKEQMILAARCVVLPSRGEGFGLVYVEGMRLGRPCLVSSLDAGREVVNPPEAGLSANPDDPTDLSDRLIDLIDGPGWSQKSEAALRRYQLLFTESHFAVRLTQALQEVLS